MEALMSNITRADEAEMDLGAGHTFASIVDPRDRLVGWLHSHPDARSSTGVVCQSFVAVRQGFGSPVYEIEIVGPLTLKPEVRCATCGDVGSVKAGRWEAK